MLDRELLRERRRRNMRDYMRRKRERDRSQAAAPRGLFNWTLELSPVLRMCGIEKPQVEPVFCARPVSSLRPDEFLEGSHVADTQTRPKTGDSVAEGLSPELNGTGNFDDHGPGRLPVAPFGPTDTANGHITSLDGLPHTKTSAGAQSEDKPVLQKSLSLP